MSMLIGSAALVLLAANVAALPVGGEILEPAFGGTIVSTYPDGRISKLWLNRDGSFSAEGRNHEHQGGHWVVKHHSVCMSQTKPFPIPFAQYCAPIPSTLSNWTGKAVTGEPVTIQLTSER